MKATEQYFPVLLFIVLYKVVLTLSQGIKSLSEVIQMVANDRCGTFLMLYKVVQTFESMNEMLSRRYSNESY